MQRRPNESQAYQERSVLISRIVLTYPTLEIGFHGGAHPRGARVASRNEFGNVTLTTEAACRVWTL